jgi:hypothetical protein
MRSGWDILLESFVMGLGVSLGSVFHSVVDYVVS